MKSSFTLGTLLPTIVALAATVGCAHGNGSASTSQASPRPALGLSAEDLDRAPGVPIEQLLASRVPGVYLTTGRDGRTVMHLRGLSTINQEEEPLFVVNGVPLGSASNFGAIDRHDIESIEVLRDAASTARYGMRGANGVIVITTKGP